MKVTANSFFKNLDEDFEMDDTKTPPVATTTKRCEIKTCKVLAAGCIDATDKLFVGASKLNFVASQDQPKGYSESVCISCTNGAATMTHDNFRVA